MKKLFQGAVIILVLSGFAIINLVYWAPKDRVIHKEEDICLSFAHNAGSNEHINIYTSLCSSEFEANKFQHSDDIILNPKDIPEVLDSASTMECPQIIILGKNIWIFQKPLCKALAHDYEESRFLHFKIDTSGQINNLTQ